MNILEYVLIASMVLWQPIFAANLFHLRPRIQHDSTSQKRQVEKQHYESTTMSTTTTTSSDGVTTTSTMKMKDSTEIPNFQDVEDEVVDIVRLLLAKDQPIRAIKFIEGYARMQSRRQCLKRPNHCKLRVTVQPFQIWLKLQMVEQNLANLITKKIIGKFLY